MVFFFFFWSGSTTCRILVIQPGIEPVPSTVKAHSPSHWTAREFLQNNNVKLPDIFMRNCRFHFMCKENWGIERFKLLPQQGLFSNMGGMILFFVSCFPVQCNNYWGGVFHWESWGIMWCQCSVMKCQEECPSNLLLIKCANISQ